MKQKYQVVTNRVFSNETGLFLSQDEMFRVLENIEFHPNQKNLERENKKLGDALDESQEIIHIVQDIVKMNRLTTRQRIHRVKKYYEELGWDII